MCTAMMPAIAGQTEHVTMLQRSPTYFWTGRNSNELADTRWFTRDEVASMLERKHPSGFSAPHPVAIAYHIIRAWVEHGIDLQ